MLPFRFLIVLLLLACMTAVLNSQPPKYTTPDDLEKLPVGLKVVHEPKEPFATFTNIVGAKYTWKYKTTVTATDDDITIIEFGGWSHHDGKWLVGKPFAEKQFAEWYKCPNAKLKKGEKYSDTNNWSTDSELRAGKTWWYFIGVDSKGNRVKGEAIIELKGEVDPKKGKD